MSGFLPRLSGVCVPLAGFQTKTSGPSFLEPPVVVSIGLWLLDRGLSFEESSAGLDSLLGHGAGLGKSNGSNVPNMGVATSEFACVSWILGVEGTVS